MTREDWARIFLDGIGAPATKRNRLVIVSWIQAEGGDAQWNPLNSTHDAVGATDYNWVGVKNYPSFDVGMTASVETLTYGANRGLYGYGAIRHNLRNNARPKKTLRAIEASEWGTGGLGLRCYPWVKRAWDVYRNKPIAN